MKLSIITAVLNRSQSISASIRSLQDQTYTEFEHLVQDGGSTDGTLAVAKRYPVKIVSIRPQDFSFGRSLNYGCQAAQGNFVVIASAHVYPLYKDWIEQLLTPFEDPRIGMVYGKQRGSKETKYSEHQVFEKWFPDKSTSNQAHPFCNNANAAIRRELWQEFPYNEELTGLEDIDWANRIIQAGYRVAYQSGAVVSHVHKEKPGQTFNRYRREAIALKTIFPAERFSLGDFTRLFAKNTVNDYKNALYNGARRKDLYEIPLFRFMQFWGTYRGFQESETVTSQLKHTFYYPNNICRKPYSDRSKPDDPLLIDYHSEGRTYRENR